MMRDRDFFFGGRRRFGWPWFTGLETETIVIPAGPDFATRKNAAIACVAPGLYGRQRRPRALLDLELAAVDALSALTEPVPVDVNPAYHVATIAASLNALADALSASANPLTVSYALEARRKAACLTDFLQTLPKGAPMSGVLSPAVYRLGGY